MLHVKSASTPIPREMFALRTATSGGLELCRIPVPAMRPDEVLVRVTYAAPCGTDLAIRKASAWAVDTVRPGTVTGHEFEGVVVDLGGLVTNARIGDRVTAEGHFTDGACERCRTGAAHVCDFVSGLGIARDGAFAEYVAIPAVNLWRLPDSLPAGWGALLDPTGNAVHAAGKGDVAGKAVLVTGAGPIGLLCIQVAKGLGAERVYASEVSPLRQKLAYEVGADAVVTADEHLERSIRALGRRPDVVLECSGAPAAINSALRIVRNDGVVVWIGLPAGDVPINISRDVIFKGLHIETVYGRRLWGDWFRAQALVDAGKITFAPLITEVVPLREFERAFDLMERGEAIKIVFDLTA